MDDTREASGQERSSRTSGRRWSGWRPPWPLLLSELVGTALLVAVGISVVIIDFDGAGSVARLLPSPGARRLLTGFLFGAIGALIAVSPVGRISGAHINPAVTLAFWLRGKLKGSYAVSYVVAQLAGAVLGSIPLRLWGRMGRDVQFGATVPGPAYGATVAMAGETVATAALVVSLFFFLSRRRIRHFTPLLFPLLYAVMVYLEAPLSGTSTNPARTLGPAVISGDWQGWWVYWTGPALGTMLAVGAHGMGWLGCFEVEVAKLFHFHHDPYGVFLPRRDGAGVARYPEAQERGA